MTETREALKVRFDITPKTAESITWEEYEAIERAQDGQPKMYMLRPLLARFMVDENLVPVPHEQAMKIIAKIPVSQVEEIVSMFILGMRDAAIPKESGGSSSPPSEQETPQASESQAG